MAVVHVVHPHALGLTRALVRAREAQQDLAPRLRARTTWDGEVLRFTRAGAQGWCRVAEGEVELHIELGLLASALRPLVAHKAREVLACWFDAVG